MSHQLKNAVGCAGCAFKPDCGGIVETAPIFGWGCYSDCILNCNPETCDLTCPNNYRLFAARLGEIEGTFSCPSPTLNGPITEIPQYVPKIHNGSGRQQALRVPFVAVPARELLHKSGLEVSCRFTSPSQIRHYFRLSDRTAYIISCISVDDEVEMVWAGLKYGKLAEEFAKLKPAAVVVPNFSFFVHDVPRTHTIYNRKRICISARMLSEAGCRVILPLSALTPNDWEFWLALLQHNQTMTCVAKEFQTGLFGPEAAAQAIEDLAKLQRRLGRPLHPVAFGGGRYRDILGSHFDAYTIIESRPFMLAAQRRRAVQSMSGSYSEVFSPTAQGETTDELLRSNIEARLRHLK